MSKDFDMIWERAPVCFSCGKEIGSDPDDVVYLGYGQRDRGQGPGWVATVCCHHETPEPSPCIEAAQEFAAEEGAPLSPKQYQRWLTSA